MVLGPICQCFQSIFVGMLKFVNDFCKEIVRLIRKQRYSVHNIIILYFREHNIHSDCFEPSICGEKKTKNQHQKIFTEILIFCYYTSVKNAYFEDDYICLNIKQL